jgi:hypothetical protein
MQFYKGYTSKDYKEDGVEIIRSFVVDGKTYYQYATELLDRVGRVIGFRATSKISSKKLS